MRNLIILLILSLFVASCNDDLNNNLIEEQSCDNGTYEGVVLLASQEDVDDFGSMCYTKIDGALLIGNFGENNDIVDLSSLNSLTQIFTSNPDTGGGDLRIQANNLNNLNGLENINSVNGLIISYCNLLSNLEGLSGLVSIGGNESVLQLLNIHSNLNLSNLNGLDNLTIIGQEGFPFYVGFAENPLLNNLNSLSNLESFSGELYSNIVGNSMLTDFCGVQNLFNNMIYELEHIEIQFNGFNPTVQNIIDGNCSQ